ncbi:MAG: YdcF family protein [Novosphingobium sp.]
MLRRISSLALIVWALGFVWFAIALPLPAGSRKTDVVVVPTGGEGRIDRGLAVLRAGWAGKMLVSGVSREVKPNEFAAHYRVEPGVMACCVTLGFESVDTRSNAVEIAGWLTATKAKSVRLVTTDWHIRRAVFELRRIVPEDIDIVEDAVVSNPSFWILFLEYHKLLAARVASLWPF